MRNRSIQTQLLIWFFVFTVIPLTTISSWCYLLASDIINQKTSSYAAGSIQQLSDNLDQLLLQIENGSLSISNNNYVQDMLSTISDGRTASRIDRFQMEKSMILAYDYNSMRDITIRSTGEGEQMIFRVPAKLDNGEENLYYPVVSAESASKPVWRSDTDQLVIQMVRPIESTTNFKKIGTLYISLYGSYIDRLVQNIDFDQKGFALILNEQNVPINIKEVDQVYLDGLADLMTNDSGSFTRKIGSVYYRYFYTVSEKTGWTALGVISISDLHSQVRALGITVLCGVGLISFVAIIFSIYLAHSFAEKIHMVTGAMKKASDGDFSIRLLEGASKNEFNDLSIGFNNMIEKINSLIRTVYEAELLQKKAEYASLEAQTNPHFLYNTLDTICCQAKLAGCDDVFDTTYALASLLLATMNNPDPNVTVGEEIQYINDYILIQKSRYRDRFNTVIAVDPQLMSLMIPKLTLQPIVENAFVHGLEGKIGKGTVSLSGILNTREQAVIFMVRDDGVGMSAEQIQNVLDEKPNSHRGFGLSNVNRRLQILYGNKFGVRIISEQGKGTTVIVRFPYNLA